MTIIPIPAFTDNYIWMLIGESSGFFDCIDPGEARAVIAFAQTNALTLHSILLTHHHHDHIGGVHELMKAYPGCQVYGPVDERIPFLTHPVQAKDKVLPDSLAFTVLSNPGHTASHISYYDTNREWLFCGDTLFSAGCGRVFDGTMEELHQSIQLFKQLPPTTHVFCAHEYTYKNLEFAHYVEPNNQAIVDRMDQITKQKSPCSLPSTIALEHLINPFMRTDMPDVVDFAMRHGARSSSSLDVFKTLRDLKNQW